jgi:glutaredoxin
MQFLEPTSDGFTIYCKSGCPNCTKVKTLLKENFLINTIIDCDEYLLEDREGFLSFIKEKIHIEYKTFPIVFYQGKFVGGYIETQTCVEKLLLDFDEITKF